MIEQVPSLRLYAAVVQALGVARGQLYSVKFGDFSKDDVERTLRGTSLDNIAAALGLRESDIAVDWEEHLTRQEVDSIKGFATHIKLSSYARLAAAVVFNADCRRMIVSITDYKHNSRLVAKPEKLLLVPQWTVSALIRS